ncbi:MULTISPECIES: hypothetical protein [Dermacoccus]|uniref:PIN domain-containing protein n=2 Tax=Dermacoccus TaxID=57495 RepID=A0A417Z4D6_9MICO|nr:hypothetical protein [Dermacoccus abyssi]RHW45149.1 hypothetical protein D1832_09850 [Dermacoccus abyssi]
MNDVVYLLDNNVLSRLTREQRRADLLRTQCFITADVLHEARGFADEVRDIPVRPVTKAVLARLVRVMHSIAPKDTSLVDLYANKGSADPVLIAIALDIMETEQDTLMPRRIILVTGDKAVSSTCQRLGVTSLGFDDFVQML